MTAEPCKKILAIQFQYLGDAVFITPALQALKKQYPDAELHVLVAKEVAPVLEHNDWINKVWAMPRSRGKLTLSETWPFVKMLRKERFDKSVVFGCNERAAIASLLAGAKVRLGSVDSKPKLLHKLAFTQIIKNETLPKPYIAMYLKLLALGWGTDISVSPMLKITANPNLKPLASKLLPRGSILCHLGTSQEKKEWPIHHWREFYKLTTSLGYSIVFSAGNNIREQSLINELKTLEPSIKTLAPIDDIQLFLAIINEAQLVIAGDTGPLQFAAGLGVPIIGIFGVINSILQTAPNYQKNQILFTDTCTCTNDLSHFATCHSKRSCMYSISAANLLQRLLSTYLPKV
jgi:ADP-heptose:LPS heptosyltransferase